VLIVKENSEEAGEPDETTERETVKETEPAGVRVFQNRTDITPCKRFALAWTVLGEKGEEENDEQHGKHCQCKRVGVTEFLCEARSEKCSDERAGISRTRYSHHQSLIFGGIPFTRERQRHRETRTTNTQQ